MTTALQQILGTKENAAMLFEALENVEEEHEQADDGVPLRWQIKLEVGEADLPKIREELREMVEDD